MLWSNDLLGNEASVSLEDRRVELVLREERLEVVYDLGLVDGKIVVHEVEQLFLHQIHFSLTEHLSVPAPVLVLR